MRNDQRTTEDKMSVAWKVYKIEFTNGDTYIGCTSLSIDERVYNHVKTPYSLVGQRIREGNPFDAEVISVVSSKEEGLLLEALHIKKGNPYGRLLNVVHNKWHGRERPHYGEIDEWEDEYDEFTE